MSYESETRRLRLESAESQARGLPMFAEIRPMARRQDPETSKQAALNIVDHLPKLQQRVLDAFRAHGPMSAKAAESLSAFSNLGFSTVRKRVSELYGRGLLRDTHQTDRGCAIYEAISSARHITEGRMSSVNPRFLCGDYQAIRVYQALYFWAREQLYRPQRDEKEAPGLVRTIGHCRQQMGRLDPDKSKRNEMDADIRARRNQGT